MSRYLDRMNNQHVPANLLGAAILERADGALQIKALLDETGSVQDHESILPAIELRITALALFMGQGQSFMFSEAGNPLGPDLFRCAAEEPLIETNDGKIAFDPESFRRRLSRFALTAPCLNVYSPILG